MTLLAELAATSRRVADTPGRNAKIAELAACLRRLAPAEIEIGVRYLSGETRQGRSGIGYALLRAAHPNTAIDAPSLTVADVDAALERIATTAGAGSKSERIGILSALLARATPEERDFLFRLLLGELRQGAQESLMIDAVAAAASLPAFSVRQAAMIANGIAAVAHAALTEGAAGLRRFALVLMQPVAPMLAQPADGVAETLRALGTAAFEWKLDGARVQVHKRGDEVRIFTRNRNDVSASAPEIVDALRAVQVRELILDGEAIALKGNGAPQPFQVTMRRFGRTLDVPAMQASLPLSVFFFDCLRHDTDTLTEAPASERFDALSRALPAPLVIPRIATSDAATAEAFYDDALRRGHEGVMAKSLVAPYEAGKRAASSLKVKRLHTLDLVVLAAEWGHGRRKGWLSNLHLPRATKRAAVRHARQDLQGHDRRNARLADTGPARARDRPRRMDRSRAPGARGRSRVQRPAGQPAVSRRTCAALRPRETLPYGQVSRRCRHDGERPRNLSGAGRADGRGRVSWQRGRERVVTAGRSAQVREQRRPRVALDERAFGLAHFAGLELLHPLRFAGDERRHGRAIAKEDTVVGDGGNFRTGHDAADQVQRIGSAERDPGGGGRRASRLA
jgi:DNA ligase-1